MDEVIGTHRFAAGNRHEAEATVMPVDQRQPVELYAAARDCDGMARGARRPDASQVARQDVQEASAPGRADQPDRGPAGRDRISAVITRITAGLRAVAD